MNPADFEAQLKAENFDEVVPVERLPGYALGEHQHAFDACALITAGDITLVVAGVASNYGVGDIFRLPAGTPHHESAGVSGVQYLSGRRMVAGA